MIDLKCKMKMHSRSESLKFENKILLAIRVIRLISKEMIWLEEIISEKYTEQNERTELWEVQLGYN